MNVKPTLYDPEEWKIISNMYFNPPTFNRDQIDPLEQLDRMEKKQKQSKNQTK